MQLRWDRLSGRGNRCLFVIILLPQLSPAVIIYSTTMTRFFPNPMPPFRQRIENSLANFKKDGPNFSARQFRNVPGLISPR